MGDGSSGHEGKRFVVGWKSGESVVDVEAETGRMSEQTHYGLSLGRCVVGRMQSG